MQVHADSAGKESKQKRTNNEDGALGKNGTILDKIQRKEASIGGKVKRKAIESSQVDTQSRSYSVEEAIKTEPIGLRQE